jgi:hypothetical protein
MDPFNEDETFSAGDDDDGGDDNSQQTNTNSFAGRTPYYTPHSGLPPPPSPSPSPSPAAAPGAGGLLVPSPARGQHTLNTRSPTPEASIQLRSGLHQHFEEALHELTEHQTNFQALFHNRLVEVVEGMKQVEQCADELAAEQTNIYEHNKRELEAVKADWQRATEELDNVFN